MLSADRKLVEKYSQNGSAFSTAGTRRGQRLELRYGVDLMIYHPSNDATSIPSLLGRDVIDRWRAMYDKSVSELAADPVSYDLRWVLSNSRA